MENELLTHAYSWYVIGVVAIISEITIGGIGLVFAGLGALTVGALVNFGLLEYSENWLLELAAFLGCTFLWTIALWKPFKKLVRGNGKKYEDIINQEASIYDEAGIKKSEKGNIRWSGSITIAEVSEKCESDILEQGTKVYIVEKRDGTLIIDTNKRG